MMIKFKINGTHEEVSSDSNANNLIRVVGIINHELRIGYIEAEVYLDEFNQLKLNPLIMVNDNAYIGLNADVYHYCFWSSRSGGYYPMDLTNDKKELLNSLMGFEIKPTLAKFRLKYTERVLGTKYRDAVVYHNFGQNQTSLYYNIAKYPSFKNNFKLTESKDLSVIDSILSKELGETTYGVEVETSKGLIDITRLQQTNFLPLRDGSISGIEYTSKVLSGDNGMASINKFLSLANGNVKVSIQESFHVHIGSRIQKEDEFVNLYKTLHKLQNEIYNLFPGEMRNTSTFKKSNKNYNEKLPTISKVRQMVRGDGASDFICLYAYYGGRNFNGFGENTYPHPQDENNDHKWRVNTRYKFVNFIPTLFNKSNTVEFRLHPPTLDPLKMKLWILLTSVITNYGITVPFEKSKCDLKNVIDTQITSDTLKSLLMEYIKGRTDYYKVEELSFTENDLNDPSLRLKIKESIKKNTGHTELFYDSNDLFFDCRSFIKEHNL